VTSGIDFLLSWLRWDCVIETKTAGTDLSPVATTTNTSLKIVEDQRHATRWNISILRATNHDRERDRNPRAPRCTAYGAC